MNRSSMEVLESEIHQVFVKLLDGKHRILNFGTHSISVPALKRRLQTLTAIPSDLQLILANNSRVLHDHQTLALAQSRADSPFTETHSNCQLAQDQDLRKFPVVVHLLLRLRGGKGGFGSLLRGAATKAGQKKPNNFDACRDMSGRRLRHVNAEKKLEEWRAEAEERKLEKMAEDFIKKKTKEVLKSGKGKGGDGAEKYVAKYREDSAKCMEEVERSVRESMSSKRKSKAEASNSSSKRLKIWFGKRKLGDGESDSEDLDEDDTDIIEDEENEKSVIIDIGSHSDSSKEIEANSGPTTGGKLESGSVNGGSSGNGSEDEDTEGSLKLVRNLDGCGEDGNTENRNIPVLEGLEKSRDYSNVVSEVPDKSHSSPVNEFVSQACNSGSDGEVVSASISESVLEKTVSACEDLLNMDKPLNFDDYHSAVELEVLGLERLKMELQGRGLKCGGTLQERAARLFLLKTTPLEMLPKKLFAKK